MVASRIAHENLDGELNDPTAGYAEKIDVTAGMFSALAGGLRAVLNDGGRIIAISRSEMNFWYFGRLQALSKVGMILKDDTFETLRSPQLVTEHDNILEAAVFVQGEEDVKSRFDWFVERKIEAGLDTGNNVYSGDDAEFMHFLRGGKLISGKRLFVKECVKARGEYSLWENLQDETAIWAYVVNSARDVYLENFDIVNKEILLKRMDDWVARSNSDGVFRVEEMTEPDTP